MAPTCSFLAFFQVQGSHEKKMESFSSLQAVTKATESSISLLQTSETWDLVHSLTLTRSRSNTSALSSSGIRAICFSLSDLHAFS